MNRPAKQTHLGDAHASGVRPKACRRHSARVRVEVAVIVETEAGKYLGLGTDLSLSGMFVQSSHNLAYGDELDLLLNGVVRVPAIVRWHGDEGFGVQFGSLSARAANVIVALLRRRHQ